MGAVGLMLLPGCYGDPPDAKERISALERQDAELHGAVDQLEEKLLGNQAMMHTWEELGRRHQQVSAIVVRNNLEHFDQMVLHMQEQQEKARKLRRSRVAEAEVSAHGPVLTRASGTASSAKARRN